MDAVRVIVADSHPLLAGEAGKLGGGTELVVAHTPDAVIQAADPALPCLLVMDASSSPDSVAAMAKELRARERTRPASIIAVVGPGPKEAAKAIDAGADDFIRRPLEEEEVCLRLRAAVARLEALDGVFQERDYFKQAVHQEERLSFKLLDRTVSLRESLAELGQTRESLHRAGQWPEGPRDPLTGLLTEESLLDCLRSLTLAAKKDGQSLSCILIGVDLAAGRQALPRPEDLKALGSILETILRKADRVGRFGKIGFLVLLSGAELSLAMGIAQRIREGLRAQLSLEQDRPPLAVCQGVSQYRLGEDAPDWMRRTGAALKRARELGNDAIASA